MKYSKTFLRRKLKEGDVILFHRKGFISRAIRIITESHWSHVAMITGDLGFLESDWDGVTLGHVDELLSENIAIYRRKNVSSTTRKAAAQMALNFIGSKYDYKQLWDLFKMVLSGQRGRPKEAGTPNNFICAEVPAKVWEMLGYPIIKGLHYSQIIPKDFAISKDWERMDGDL